ncbi:hypothetical protein FZC84_01340 [Rossellomorea vietnamensis]|uniref:Uncharacterized protein n=1 Tax=Rossellomorea vietnamensis TaxID=218284 RepID=A0A5D4MI46_9BACI|nr:hypothetical protein [Rossellomorea vietnamensis]TYS01332.1 hypothetical protein FZC84_01340 [Rossellomorea vietnamensis]
MSETAQLIIFILTTIGVLVLFKKSKDDEPLLLLKLFGFTFIGAFMLDLESVKLPLGFAVFLLFFRNPKLNAETKHIAASVGLGIFMLNLFIPQAEAMVYERTHHVDLQNTNFYEGSLVEELVHLKDYFNMDRKSTELRGLDMVIHEDGTYKFLSFGLVEQTHDGTVNYIIDLSDDRKSFDVSRYKVKKEQEEYLNHLQFTDAELVLSNIDIITPSMFDIEGKEYYQLKTDGLRENYDVHSNNTFKIDTAGKHEIEKDQLPAQTIVAEVCGSKELTESHYPFKCEQDEYFLLDMLPKSQD